MRHIFHLVFIVIIVAIQACTPQPKDIIMSEEQVVIYPDYRNVTIPCNIAPLNFLLRGEYDAVAVAFNNEQTILSKGNKVIFSKKQWETIVANTLSEKKLEVTITAKSKKDSRWYQYPSFNWTISPDSIDSYLTYRLIEPGYEVWDKVDIEERCIETFETRNLANGKELGNRCMNCHTHGGNQGQFSFFHIRGQGGGTILNRDGKLRKVTLRNNQMKGGAVYGDFHPTGRYGVFSTNVIIPSFHSEGIRRFEVFDTSSDICLADFDSSKMILSPLFSNTDNTLETFPCFSADGQWIYYCSSPNPCGDTIPSAYQLRDYVGQLHYSLCRVSFNAADGSIGEKADTIYNYGTEGGSANLPKSSPDGKWIAFTLSSYGTFPIWHSEARLHLIDSDGNNHPTSENGTYHSWSHNSKWIAYASKRADGQYGRVYFSHVSVGEDGKTPILSKALVLPQADPEMDDINFRSFNIPDLSNTRMPFENKAIKQMIDQMNSETFQ